MTGTRFSGGRFMSAAGQMLAAPMSGLFVLGSNMQGSAHATAPALHTSFCTEVTYRYMSVAWPAPDPAGRGQEQAEEEGGAGRV